MKRLLTAAVLCAVLILGSVWSIKAVDNTAQAVAPRRRERPPE